MKIENQIKELLFLHDCVIVPNFGAFLSQDKNATLDSSTQQFQPPYKAISFNSSLKKNDGLLVNELKNKYKLEYDQALEIIQNQVNFWKEHLESGKDLVLDKIGNLKYNEIGAIEFSPNHQNFLLSSFGLPKVNVNYILEEKLEQRNANRFSGLFAAASLVPILIGGFLYFNTPQPVQNFVDEQWSGIVLPMIGKNEAKVETSKTNVLETVNHLPKIEKTNENVKTSLSTQSVVVNTTVKGTGKYQVVAGSYRRLDEAQEAIAKLNKNGYANAGMVYKKGSYFYVNYDSFDSQEQARVYLNKIHETEKEAWIRTN